MASSEAINGSGGFGAMFSAWIGAGTTVWSFRDRFAATNQIPDGVPKSATIRTTLTATVIIQFIKAPLEKTMCRKAITALSAFNGAITNHLTSKTGVAFITGLVAGHVLDVSLNYGKDLCGIDYVENPFLSRLFDAGALVVDSSVSYLIGEKLSR